MTEQQLAGQFIQRMGSYGVSLLSPRQGAWLWDLAKGKSHSPRGVRCATGEANGVKWAMYEDRSGRWHFSTPDRPILPEAEADTFSRYEDAVARTIGKVLVS